MKTPMQEHIEWLKEEIEAYALLLDVKKVEALTLAKEHAEAHLEKEKERMKNAWNTAHQAGRFEGKGIAEEGWETFENYYNEHFNTKEK